MDEFDYENPETVYREPIANPSQDEYNRQVMANTISENQPEIPKDPHSMDWKDLLKHAASMGGGNSGATSFQQASAYRPALEKGYGVPQGGLGQMKGAMMSMI